ncbi:MAG: flippase-like domain-containing protein, partial [Thermomicrobium sp.]|nr:flippase-like domain-containing protein [Thermomicrobium sp.]
VLGGLFPLVTLLVLGSPPSDSLRLLQLAAVLGSILVVLALIALRRTARVLHRFPPRLQRPIAALAGALALDVRMGARLLGTTLPLWALEGLRVYAESRALGLHFGLALALLVALIAALLTTIPLTPAGIGAVELGIAGTLLVLGLPAEQAIALALLDRLVAYWSVFVVAGPLWLTDYLRRN